MDTSLRQLLVFFAGCPRVIGLVAFAPGFDAAFVPPLVRVVIAGALAFALAPLIAPRAAEIGNLTPQGYVALLLSELTLGAIIGFFLGCLLEAARLGGEVVDLQIGFRAGALFDPLGSVTDSLLGRFWYLVALLFFFEVNGHHWLMAGLFRSFQLCPVGELAYQRQLVPLACDVVAALFTLALQLAAPVIASLILADLTLGLVGRGIPQMNILLVGLPAKIMAGLVALTFCSPMMVTAFTEMLELFRGYLSQILRAVS